MSVFDADVIKDGLSLNEEQLIAVLESELPVAGSYTSASATTVSVTTPTSIGSLNVSCEADEYCIFTAQCTLSCYTLGAKAICSLYVNGVDMDSYQIYKEQVAGDASGEICPISLRCKAEDLTGTITFSFRGARYSGSGDIAFGRIRLWVERYKKR